MQYALFGNTKLQFQQQQLHSSQYRVVSAFYNIHTFTPNQLHVLQNFQTKTRLLPSKRPGYNYGNCNIVSEEKKEMLPVFKELLARFLGHRQLMQSPTGLRLHRRGRHAPDD